jgi:hypothetical protein
MFKSKIDEAAYVGNIGAMEMFRFHQKATADQKKKLQQYIKNKDTKNAWKHVQDVTGTKLHKSVSEAVKPDILPVSGAGQEGTGILRQNYQDATPGQKMKRFKDYTKHK